MILDILRSTPERQHQGLKVCGSEQRHGLGQRDEVHQHQLEASDRRKSWWLGVIAVLVALASVPGITDLVKSVLQSQ